MEPLNGLECVKKLPKAQDMDDGGPPSPSGLPSQGEWGAEDLGGGKGFSAERS